MHTRGWIETNEKSWSVQHTSESIWRNYLRIQSSCEARSRYRRLGKGIRLSHQQVTKTLHASNNILASLVLAVTPTMIPSSINYQTHHFTRPRPHAYFVTGARTAKQTSYLELRRKPLDGIHFLIYIYNRRSVVRKELVPSTGRNIHCISNMVAITYLFLCI
jgi:hypothetical protein